MAAQLIAETDVIEVANPPVLLYGQPGTGKSSLAFTADKPLCLDFDMGAHRSAFRKSTMRFESWEDVVQEQRQGRFNLYQTIILDTVGTLLELMAQTIIADSAKLGTKAGGLTLQGFGVLKGTFGSWLAGLRQSGKQVVMIAHQKEDKDGDSRFLRPDITGGSYGAVMQSADVVGYMSYRNGKRSVSWEPTDSYFAKNGAQLKSGPIPDFANSPRYLADLLDQARKNLGHTAAASASAAQIVAEWTARLDADPSLDQLNAMLPDLGKLTNGTKSQAWHLIKARAEAAGLTFDKATKRFTAPATEGVPA